MEVSLLILYRNSTP